MKYQDLIDDHVARGWRIERQRPALTVLRKGRARFTWWGHAWAIGLSILTGGLWLIVYAWRMAIRLRERRIVKLPDGNGHVETPDIFRW